jgi:ribosomal protein S18 acetylase RimI-like enzyme
MTEIAGFTQGSPEGYAIRAVTAASLEEDLAAGRLVLPPGAVDGMDERLFQRDVTLLVAEGADGSPRGQVGVNWGGPVADHPLLHQNLEGVPEVGFAMVQPPYRREGVAQALMRAVYDEAGARSEPDLCAVVGLSNETARSFLRKQGFRGMGLGSFVLPIFVDNRAGGYLPAARFSDVIVMTKNLVAAS